ncbi:MAG: peptidylprolyl isomerase [Bacteroidota bacterium]|nr:peptidylprolyl isomerase [Chlorobiota bacterium]MDW8074701.1 peptidylprolyl isomerase [Bacteroidota bacterium]MDW8270823.1 peptidylprolyl isomerase [Bacteroidota bacterium]
MIRIAGLFVALMTAAAAQQWTVREGDVLDCVVAVAAGEPILKSEVDAQVLLMLQQNPALRSSESDLRQRVLDALINDRLMYVQAQLDSITVSDEEVNLQLEMTIQQLVRQVGSEERLENIYQMPMWKIRQDGREEIRKRLLTERYRQMKMADIKVTPREVEEFYERYKDSLPTLGKQYELYHIVRYVVPTQQAREDAYVRAKGIRDSLLRGADFCTMASRYSEDPNTRTGCGDLGMRNCSDFVPEFCSACKKLQVGEISMPIETPFGYHIVRMVERTVEQIHVQHILITIPRGDIDQERVRADLEQLRQRILSGEISFEQAARQYSDEQDTRGFGGALGKLAAQTLEPSLAALLDTLPDGGITAPLPYTTNPTRQGFHILWKKRTLPPHKPTLETDYKELENFALTMKQQQVYERLVATLRRQLHWEVLR